MFQTGDKYFKPDIKLVLNIIRFMKIRINCKICKYYYVTWEPSQPHGCKAYGFKSQQVPSVVVKQSSGTQCSFYDPKR